MFFPIGYAYKTWRGCDVFVKTSVGEKNQVDLNLYLKHTGSTMYVIFKENYECYISRNFASHQCWKAWINRTMGLHCCDS